MGANLYHKKVQFQIILICKVCITKKTQLKIIRFLRNDLSKNCFLSNQLGFTRKKGKIFLRKSQDALNIYHHIGIYSYSSEILKNFVELAQSKNEIENRLEQLRALDNNIKINVALADKAPIGVDTEEDYLALKKIMEYKS